MTNTALFVQVLHAGLIAFEDINMYQQARWQLLKIMRDVFICIPPPFVLLFFTKKNKKIPLHVSIALSSRHNAAQRNAYYLAT